MISRPSVLTRPAESWRPPLFGPSRTRVDRLKFALRRFADLQTASIWNDLSAELGTARGTVLDVGCGAQPYRGLFAPDVKYIGIDSVKARAHFGYDVPDTRYFEGTTWPVEEGSIDFVLCTETLEHVPEPAPFIDEAMRALAPGGRILLTVPFAARWHFIPHDYWRFTPSGLSRLLGAAGFRDIAVYARGNETTVACYKAMALLLPLLMPQGPGALRATALRCVGVVLSPLLVLLAVIGQLSLRGRGGDDCLGYTCTARKASM